MGLIYADRSLYWDADRRIVVEESDVRQAWLCISEGAQVTEEWLKRTKCTVEDGKIVLPVAKLAEEVVAEEVVAEEVTETKKRRGSK